MKHYDIVATLVDQGDSYCLELRSGASNGAVDLLGLFGGKIEDGESALEAACRELREESNLSPQPDELEPIGEVSVRSDRDNQPITVRARLFRLRTKPGTAVEAKVGEAITILKADIPNKLGNMSPVARAYFETTKE